MLTVLAEKKVNSGIYFFVIHRNFFFGNLRMTEKYKKRYTFLSVFIGQYICLFSTFVQFPNLYSFQICVISKFASISTFVRFLNCTISKFVPFQTLYLFKLCTFFSKLVPRFWVQIFIDF